MIIFLPRELSTVMSVAVLPPAKITCIDSIVFLCERCATVAGELFRLRKPLAAPLVDGEIREECLQDFENFDKDIAFWRHVQSSDFPNDLTANLGRGARRTTSPCSMPAGQCVSTAVKSMSYVSAKLAISLTVLPKKHANAITADLVLSQSLQATAIK
jgi:hypothetical protein